MTENLKICILHGDKLIFNFNYYLMETVLVVVLVVVVLGMAVTLGRQNRKLRELKKDYYSVVQQIGSFNSRLRFYNECMREILPCLSKDVSATLKEKVLDQQKETECYRHSPQREGKIIACREIVGLIDDATKNK